MRLLLAALAGLVTVTGVFAMATPAFAEAPIRVKWIYGALLLATIMGVTYYALSFLGIPERVWIFGGTNT